MEIWFWSFFLVKSHQDRNQTKYKCEIAEDNYDEVVVQDRVIPEEAR